MACLQVAIWYFYWTFTMTHLDMIFDFSFLHPTLSIQNGYCLLFSGKIRFRTECTCTKQQLRQYRPCFQSIIWIFKCCWNKCFAGTQQHKINTFCCFVRRSTFNVFTSRSQGSIEHRAWHQLSTKRMKGYINMLGKPVTNNQEFIRTNNSFMGSFLEVIFSNSPIYFLQILFIYFFA